MNMQRWVVASIVVTLVVAILEMIIHGFILQSLYQQSAAIWRLRTEAQALMPLMWLGYAVFAPFFVWIYAQGIDPKEDAIGQGVRFGLMFSVGLSAMYALIWYVVLPIPQTLAFGWFLGGVAVYTAAGVAAALVYEPAAKSQPSTSTQPKRRRQPLVEKRPRS